MTLNEYQKLAARTISKELSDHEKACHALHGMVSEIGEIHGIYQKGYQGHDVDPEHLQKELGDLLWFVAEYCTALHWELDSIGDKNIKKLIARYPEGFDAQNSLHRAKDDI
jgi:NTP pyrophosphatase (non-canonical NTP hydrolase)